MNLRHAAALALVGWYLMAPHVYYDPKKADMGYSGWMRDGAADSSLSAWQLIGSYDSAAECESARDALQKSGGKFGKFQGEGAIGAKREPEAYNKATSAALDRVACIATENAAMRRRAR
jgi:hypothetical protein